MKRTDMLREHQVVALTRAGKPAAEIAALVGVHKRTVERIRSRHGLANPAQPSRFMTEQEKRTALALLDDGASYMEVGATLGRAPKTIAGAFPGRGWTQQQGGTFGAMLRWNRTLAW